MLSLKLFSLIEFISLFFSFNKLSIEVLCSYSNFWKFSFKIAVSFWNFSKFRFKSLYFWSKFSYFSLYSFETSLKYFFRVVSLAAWNFKIKWFNFLYCVFSSMARMPLVPELKLLSLSPPPPMLNTQEYISSLSFLQKQNIFMIKSGKFWKSTSRLCSDFNCWYSNSLNSNVYKNKGSLGFVIWIIRRDCFSNDLIIFIFIISIVALFSDLFIIIFNSISFLFSLFCKTGKISSLLIVDGEWYWL